MVSDSGAQEKIGHDGGFRRTGRRDRTWWLMEEHRKKYGTQWVLEEGGREGWDTVDNCKGWINNRGEVEEGLGHKRKYNGVWWVMEHGKEEWDGVAQERGKRATRLG